MLPLMTLRELQLYLGKKIKEARLSENKTQKELAAESDIPLSTYQKLEQKGEGSLKDFLKILIALNRINELETLLDHAKYSPVEEYQSRKKAKKRVRHAHKS